MLRNKLSFILASSLSLSFVACDDGDDGGDTGAGATESSGTESDTTDTPTTDTPTTDTPTTDTPTTDDPTTDDSSTTDDTSDDSSTTDDTSADPCADVVCEDGESCVGGICVEDGGETDTAGETEGETETGAGECSAAVMFNNATCGECAEGACCDALTDCFGDINEVTEPTACGLLNDCLGAALQAAALPECMGVMTQGDLQACADAACPDTSAALNLWLGFNNCVGMSCAAQCM